MTMEKEIEVEIGNAYLTPVLCSLINMANTDLYHGPLYLNAEGDTVSMFDDDYTHAFDFSRACTIIRDALDRRLPDSLYYETWSGCILTAVPEPYEDDDGEMVEPELSELYEFDSQALRVIAVGKELARHV